MMKSTQTIAVVRRRMKGNDPMGCGFGAGRASGLFRLAVDTSGAEFIVSLTSRGKWRWHFVSGIIDAGISVQNIAIATRPAPRRISTCPNVTFLKFSCARCRWQFLFAPLPPFTVT
jgi:hypothetical protein